MMNVFPHISTVMLAASCLCAAVGYSKCYYIFTGGSFDTAAQMILFHWIGGAILLACGPMAVSAIQSFYLNYICERNMKIAFWREKKTTT
ncbi:MAG: hypothetical protein LBI34_01740 [Puniceicoccales bacterium]|jgi:hypothetical protein|nr:hypothetical protein [Puniceicoccales bacterium]